MSKRRKLSREEKIIEKKLKWIMTQYQRKLPKKRPNN